MSYSVLSQVAKKPLGSGPRTSTPEPQSFVSARDRQQNVSSVYRKDIVSEEKTRNQFDVSYIKFTTFVIAGLF